MDIHSGSSYRLKNANCDTVLDLSRTGHIAVMGWSWHGGDNQKWILKKQKNGLWTIQNIADNKYLGIKGGLCKNGTHVIGIDEAVYWDIKRDTEKDAGYRICVPGMSLSLHLGDSKNRTPVQISSKWTPGVNQTWILYKEPGIKSGGIYKLTNAQSGTVLDLSQSCHGVSGYGWHGGNNQKWILQEHSNRLWTIQNVADKKYLGIKGGLLEDGTSVIGVNEAVYWNIKRSALNEANYRISVPERRFNLDLASGDSKSGTAVQIWSKLSPGMNQMWTFSEDILLL